MDDKKPWYSIRAAASAVYKVPLWLINGIITAESAWRPDAVSPCGAQGLMQLMPIVCQEYEITDPFDPEQNIMGGTRHIARQLKSRFVRGNIPLALAAYNAGIGNVKRYRGIPPFEKTRKYVAKIMAIKPLDEPDNINDTKVKGETNG